MSAHTRCLFLSSVSFLPTVVSNMLCFDYRDVNPEYKSMFFPLGSPRGKQRGKEENIMSSREMQK